MNNASLDSPAMRNSSLPGYRVWVSTKPARSTKFVIETITLQAPGGAEIRPSSERRYRLFVGTVPSHGIIEPLRARFPQYEFASVPSGDYDVVVHTNSGVRRYRVTAAERAKVLNVCNKRL